MAEDGAFPFIQSPHFDGVRFFPPSLPSLKEGCEVFRGVFSHTIVSDELMFFFSLLKHSIKQLFVTYCPLFHPFPFLNRINFHSPHQKNPIKVLRSDHHNLFDRQWW